MNTARSTAEDRNYGRFSGQRLAMWIPSTSQSKGMANDVGASSASFQVGMWMVTLATPLPAMPGTRTEPPISAPHHVFFKVAFVTIGGAPGFFAGDSIWATAFTGGAMADRTRAAKLPLPRPGVPTRTRNAIESAPSQ